MTDKQQSQGPVLQAWWPSTFLHRALARHARHAHREAVTRPKRNQRLGLHWVARHEPGATVLQNSREDELQLHHREAITDALSRPSAEWKIGVTRSLFFLLGLKPSGIKPFRIRPKNRISVSRVRR